MAADLVFRGMLISFMSKILKANYRSGPKSVVLHFSCYMGYSSLVQMVLICDDWNIPWNRRPSNVVSAVLLSSELRS